MAVPSVPDYAIGKGPELVSGALTCFGVRRSDGLGVVLRSYVEDRQRATGELARSEFDALRAVAGPGVPNALELVADLQPPWVVLEKSPGQSLSNIVSESPLTEKETLEVAIQLCRILARVHERGYLYCRLNPDDVYVEEGTLRTHLVHFGSARTLGAVEQKHSSTLEHIRPLLPFYSPEQTGRMARGMDARSDLYSLGALLYFALTGCPPFESDDPLALIHAHMARTPVPPLERRPELPPTLSRIVLKLLQKEPSDRYQAAHALERDLCECQHQLASTGCIADDLPLGTADIPIRPMFSMRLFGRSRECRALHEAYARIREQQVELLVIMGPPGVGKSALLHDLRPVISETGGYLAQGKFDLYRRDVPYSGLLAALESLVQQILRESDARVALWRDSLRRALGRLAGVVTELIPDLALLLPDAAPVPRLAPRETQARLVYALERLVLGCGRPEHPLVLFIDDLQWADPGSRTVLESLLAESRGAALLVVTTCRDEHEPTWRPVARLVRQLRERQVRVTELSLEPLGIEATEEMLSDALLRPIDQVRSLAERVAAKTGSNPLWIQQFISHLHDLGLISYAPSEGWRWEDADIEAAAVPEGAVGLLVAKLERLPARPRSLLQFASCVSDEFEVELLSELTGDPRDALEPPLFALAKEGLLAPSANGFRFVHDRVREAAQALLTEEERSRLHHRTARLVLERSPDAVHTDRVFEIADHFNRSLRHLGEAERAQALGVNVSAGTRALGAGAAETAHHYFVAGRELFRESDWASAAKLCFDLWLQSAEAAYLNGDFELSLSLLDVLDQREHSSIQAAHVSAKRIACMIAVRSGDVLRYTIEQLRRFGWRAPKRPSYLRARITLEYTHWRLGGSRDASAFGGEPPADPGWAAPILVTGAGASAMVRQGNAMLLCITTCSSLLRFERHGALPGISMSMAVFTAMLASLRFRMRREAIERYVALTLDCMARVPSPIDVRARFSLHCFTLPYLRPRHSLLDPLRQIAEDAAEVGDKEYALYAAAHRAMALSHCGPSLREVVLEFERLYELTELPIARSTFAALAEVYELLEQPTASGRDWSSDPPAIRALLEVVLDGDQLPAFHWFMVLCYFGQFERASLLLPRFTLDAFSAQPSSGIDFMLFQAVCLGANAARANWSVRMRALNDIRIGMWFVRGRILPNSDFEHVTTAVQAECARLKKGVSKALSLYQRAAREALDRGYPMRAALLHERRADLLLERRHQVEGWAALQQAHDLYMQWGAHAKVRQLERALRH